MKRVWPESALFHIVRNDLTMENRQEKEGHDKRPIMLQLMTAFDGILKYPDT